MINEDKQHELAWHWFEELEPVMQDRVLYDIDCSVTIWHNRLYKEWQRDLEDYVKEHSAV